MSVISFCGVLASNVGNVKCDPKREAPQLVMIGGGDFDSDDYADADTWQAALVARTKLPNSDASKLFPLPIIQGTADKTTAAKFGTLGYGLEVKIVDSRPSYEFDILCGSSLEKSLKAFDGQEVPVIVYDKGSTSWGKANSSGVFSGAVYLFSMEPRPFQDGQAAKTTKVTISMVDSNDAVVNAAGINYTLTTSEIKGLNDAIIYQAASNTTNVYNLSAKIISADLTKVVNVAEVFGSTLANVALWSAKTGVDYATTLVITSITLHSSGKYYVVTFNSSAYTALSTGDKIKVTLADPAALDAADVTDIESVALIITK